MDYLKNIILSFCLLLSWTFSSFAQEVVAADGDYFENSNGSLAYTVGEIMTETYESGDGIFTQGFQQNFEDILSLPGLLATSNFQVYPNPFNNKIIVQWSNNSSTAESFKIKDAFGKTVRENNILNDYSSGLVIDDLKDLAPGIYYLIVSINNSSEPLLFKVIKK